MVGVLFSIGNLLAWIDLQLFWCFGQDSLPILDWPLRVGLWKELVYPYHSRPWKQHLDYPWFWYWYDQGWFGQQLGYYCQVWYQVFHGSSLFRCWYLHDWSIRCWFLLCLLGRRQGASHYQAQRWWTIHLGICCWWLLHHHPRWSQPLSWSWYRNASLLEGRSSKSLATTYTVSLY